MDLKQTIREKKLRQCDIAEQLGVSQPTMSRWIHRGTDVPTKMVRPLADALGVSVEDVLPLCEPMPEQATA